MIAIVVLHAGPAEVSLLAATGLAVGAAVAVPLGPWVEFQPKRPVMVATDLVRFVALTSIPAAFALGCLSFAQLVVVSVVVAFKAASGAFLKSLVRPEDLLVAHSRFESTAWTATVIGPPLGGAAVGLFGPVTAVVADAASYLLSALGVRAVGGTEPRPARTGSQQLRHGGVREGWRYVLTHPSLRPLLFNTVLVNGLIMATAPLLAVLMLGELGFAPWQYGLAFAVPCLGGLVLVIVVELGLITCMGVFNPVFAAYRLDQTATGRVARTLSAWSVTTSATVAAMTALWGLLASLTSARTAIAVAGLLLLATPLLLPRHDQSAGGQSAVVVGRSWLRRTRADL